MKKEKHEEIIQKLQGMPIQEQISFLEKNIEEIDYDNNGYNDEIREKLNALKIEWDNACNK